MRQAGVIAAAALYALDHNVERLAEDHARARRLAEGIGARRSSVETNFVEHRGPRRRHRAAAASTACSSAISGPARCARSRTSGVTDDDIDRAIELIPRALAADRVHA